MCNMLQPELESSLPSWCLLGRDCLNNRQRKSYRSYEQRVLSFRESRSRPTLQANTRKALPLSKP